MGGRGRYGYSRAHRLAEIAGIVLVLALLVWLGVHVCSTAGVEQLPWVGLTALLAHLAADLLSGLVHWAADRLGDEHTPVFGPNMIRPFREHHTDPLGITRHDMIETNGNNCLFALPWLALAGFGMPSGPGPLYYGCLFVGFTMAMMVATNQIHRWAHVERPPALVRPLQRLGLVLTAEHHALHHRAPHSRCYCITAGWLNPLLDRIGFFRAIERGVFAVFPRMLAPPPPEPVTHSTSTRL